MYNIYAHVHTHTLYCQNSTATHNSPKLETTEFSSALKYVIKSQYNCTSGIWTTRKIRELQSCATMWSRFANKTRSQGSQPHKGLRHTILFT